MSSCIRCGLIPLPGALYCEECIGARRAVLATGATGQLVPSNGANGARRGEEAQAVTDGRLACAEDNIAALRELLREERAASDGRAAQVDALTAQVAELTARVAELLERPGAIEQLSLTPRVGHGAP